MRAMEFDTKAVWTQSPGSFLRLGGFVSSHGNGDSNYFTRAGSGWRTVENYEYIQDSGIERAIARPLASCIKGFLRCGHCAKHFTQWFPNPFAVDAVVFVVNPFSF